MSQRRQGGFTLIEVLTVAVILGILAAIAVPLFAAQRGRARDTATKEDLAVLAKAVTASFTDTGSAPTVQIAAGTYQVAGEDVGAVSSGVRVAGASATVVDTTGWTATAWCLGLTNPGGDQRDYKYSPQQGLQQGTCASTTTP